MPMIRARPVRGKRRRRMSGTVPESRSTSEIARPIGRAIPARTPRASSSDAAAEPEAHAPPSSCLAMTSFWISLVPSPIVQSLTSR